MTAPPAPAPWPVRAAGLLAVAVFLALIARFWHPVYGLTAFFQLDGANDDLKIAAFRTLPVYVHRETGGYDGLYYAQIAHDPSLRDPELPRAMDNLPYRARRILPPALAWLVGVGHPPWIVTAYSLLNIAAWLALAALLWRLLAVRDLRGWLAWAGLLFSAGALGSVRLALSDLVALALLAAAFLALERDRTRSVLGWLAAAGLARETSLLAVAGAFERPWLSARNLLRALLVAVPLAAWLGYIRWRVGGADQGWSNFTWPGAGWLEKVQSALADLALIADRPLAWGTLLAAVGLTVQALWFVLRRDLADRWWRLGAAYAAMLLFLGTAVWEGQPGAATRVLLPLNLAFNVLVHRARASLAWLLLGNLTVVAGLVSLRDIPRDWHELAAVRRGDIACVAREGTGWHGGERSAKHRWHWNSGRGTVRLQAWSAADTPLDLVFSLRALRPCTVRVVQNGRTLAELPAGPTRTAHRVRARLAAAAGEIEFVSDQPPVPEKDAPGARLLGFALYDLALELPKP